MNKIKAFIIYLPRYENSIKAANQLKLKLIKFNNNIDVNLFEGVYGDDAEKDFARTDRKVHHFGIKGPIPPHIQRTYYRAGVMGCFMSHYNLWKKCINLNEPIMIFEDDADVIRPYYNVEFEDVLTMVFSHRKKMAKYIDYLENPEGDPEAKKYKQTSMPGNAGYYIKPHAAKALVEEYANTFLPADNCINQKVVKIQIHSHMMGKAIEREPYMGKTSFIKNPRLFNPDYVKSTKGKKTK